MPFISGRYIPLFEVTAFWEQNPVMLALCMLAAGAAVFLRFRKPTGPRWASVLAVLCAIAVAVLLFTLQQVFWHPSIAILLKLGVLVWGLYEILTAISIPKDLVVPLACVLGSVLVLSNAGSGGDGGVGLVLLCAFPFLMVGIVRLFF